MLFPTLGPSSLPVVVAQPDERSDVTDTEHSKTSISNEEEEVGAVNSVLNSTDTGIELEVSNSQ